MSKMKFILIPAVVLVGLFFVSSKFKKTEVEDMNNNSATTEQHENDGDEAEAPAEGTTKEEHQPVPSEDKQKSEENKATEESGNPASSNLLQGEQQKSAEEVPATTPATEEATPAEEPKSEGEQQEGSLLLNSEKVAFGKSVLIASNSYVGGNQFENYVNFDFKVLDQNGNIATADQVKKN